MFKGIREDWRTDRARLVWFLVHAAALGINMAVTLGRGRAFVIAGVVITVDYGVGYLVLTLRARRRHSSSPSNRNE